MGCLRIMHAQRSELRLVYAKKAVTSNYRAKSVRSSYLFGMLMPGRHDELSGGIYAYRFSAHKKDDEKVRKGIDISVFFEKVTNSNSGSGNTK